VTALISAQTAATPSVSLSAEIASGRVAWCQKRMAAVGARAPDQRRERQEHDQAEVAGRDSLRKRATGAA